MIRFIYMIFRETGHELYKKMRQVFPAPEFIGMEELFHLTFIRGAGKSAVKMERLAQALPALRTASF